MFGSRITRILAVVSIVGFVAISALGQALAAKEFLLSGTVDCGRGSGQRCDIGQQIRVWTTDVSGYRERVTVDLSWVTRQLDAYDQDDLICLEVAVGADGTLQAVGVSATCGAPDARRKPREDDDDPPKPTPEAPTPTSTPTASPTATATATATRTFTPTATSTATATAAAAQTATASATATATATATFTPTATPTPTFTPTPTATSTFTPTSTPTPRADLSLTKTGGTDGCTFDVCAFWTITVTNNGPNTATNVVVTDIGGGGYTYVPMTGSIPSQGTYNEATGVWTVGTLSSTPGSNTATLDIAVAYDPDRSGSMTNCAEVTSSDLFDPDSTPGNGNVNPPEDDYACSTVTNGN